MGGVYFTDVGLSRLSARPLDFSMTADSAIYDSHRMAAAYAFTRPPIHRQVAARVARYLAPACPVNLALDIGCGAGMSTAALAPLARRTVGLEPHAPMLAHRSTVAPDAGFAIGRAEALPFADGTFDLVTAAGALNYADLALSLNEVARVLSRHGLFVPYDFSAGRRLRDDDRLNESGTPTSNGNSRLHLDIPWTCGPSTTTHAVSIWLDSRHTKPASRCRSTRYVDYILGESGVEQALAEGRLEADIRRNCEDGLRSIFSGAVREVIFDAQIAYVRK